jgi:hypothetical protein
MSHDSPTPQHGPAGPAQPPQGAQPGGHPYGTGPYPPPGATPSAVPTKKSWFARHKVLTGIGAIFALIVVASAAGGAGDEGGSAAAPAAPAASTPADDTTTEPDDAAEDEEAAVESPAEEPAAEEPAAEDPAAEPAPAGIGDTVADGKFEFTVTQVEEGVQQIGNDMFGAEAQGQFVLVHVTVRNIGTEAQYFDGSSQKLQDSLGRSHSADSGAAIYLDDSNSFLNQINPGNAVDGIVVFDVPADAELDSVTLHDSMFSGGVTVALG